MEQTDARGCVTSLTYDSLNRLLGKSYSNASGGNCAAIAANAAPVSYSYDQGVNGIGQRTGMSDASGSVSWSYDARGRLVSELRQVGSYGSFASAWGYNSADGLAWRQYPGGNNGQLGELVSYSYDQRLQLATVTGDYAYVSASAYDAAGRLLQRSLGNAAVLSQYSYYPWEQQGGRLQQLLSGTPADSDSLQDLRYTYDLSGNLLSLQDYLAGAPQTQSFAYDALERLVSAAASGGDNGLGDYSLEMAYDPDSGNLSQKGELYYRYLDSGHSHAVTAVSDGWRYEYDPNGNLVRKAYRPGLYFPLVLLTEPEETLGAPPESQAEPTSPYPLPEEQSRAEPSGLLAWLHSAWDFIGRLFGSGRRTALAAGLQQDDPPEAPEEVEYGYDAENRLVSVSAGEMQASILYDGDGQRVAAVIAGAVTVYIGEVFEWDVTDSSMTRYYYAGAQRVATRTGSAAPVWLLGDHLGSTSVAANPDGSLLSRQGYLPWGELRYTEGSLPGRYQFTGQASYESEFGLYFYKARWYDPHLGRFSQPDSIVPLATQGVQAFDRYAYVNNNPIKYSDPSGHFCYDSANNEFSEGDCFDDMQQELLDYFIEQLESGDYTDIELMENLLKKAFELNSDAVIALRAASEIVRESTPGGFGWSYDKPSKFYYRDHTNIRFDDSGFGDLMDRGTPNQVAHTIGIAYIAAYQERAGFGGLFTNVLVWGNEFGKNQSKEQTNIDRDLGYIAADLGEALVANKSEAISNAVSQIDSYNYAEKYTPWWQKIKWPWSK